MFPQFKIFLNKLERLNAIRVKHEQKIRIANLAGHARVKRLHRIRAAKTASSCCRGKDQAPLSRYNCCNGFRIASRAWKESDRLRKNARRRQGGLRDRQHNCHVRRERRTGERHARPRRRNRRLARAVADASRLRYRAGGAGDGRTRAAQRHGAAARRRARL